MELIWDQKNCLLVKPKHNDWNLATLKKQLRIIEKICGLDGGSNVLFPFSLLYVLPFFASLAVII